MTKEVEAFVDICQCMDEYCDTHTQDEQTIVEKALKEYSKLKSIEEQLDCSLEVREKAFDKGFYDEIILRIQFKF